MYKQTPYRIVLDLAVLAALTGLASAQELTVVHAIDGTELGLSKDLLVDIELDGAGALEDVPFGASVGDIPLTVGSHDVVIRLSDDMPASFTGTVVLDETFSVAAFESAVVVANLDTNRTIRLTKFTVDSRPLAPGEARVAVALAAVAPDVDLWIRGRENTKTRARLRLLESGEQSDPLVVPEGTYQVRVKPTFGKGVVAQLDTVPVSGNLLLVAAGAVDTGTFTVIAVTIAP